MICLLEDIDLAPLVLQLLCTCKCLGPKNDGAGKVGCERLKGWKDIYIYIYVYESNVDELQFGISPFAPPKIVGNLALSQIGGPIKSPNIFKGFLWGCASFELAEI